MSLLINVLTSAMTNSMPFTTLMNAHLVTKHVTSVQNIPSVLNVKRISTTLKENVKILVMRDTPMSTRFASIVLMLIAYNVLLNMKINVIPVSPTTSSIMVSVNQNVRWEPTHKVPHVLTVLLLAKTVQMLIHAITVKMDST
jgi:hypothetical protein